MTSDLFSRWQILLLLVLIFTGGAVHAQQFGSLRALVISADTGEPIVGAHITVYNENNEIVYVNVTNLDGFSLFRDLDAKVYRFRVTSLGYMTLEQYVEVEPGQRDVIRIRMEPSVDEMDEILVEGRRDNTAGRAGIDRIQRDDLARIPTAGLSGDLASYLSTLPGVVTTGDSGGDLYIRGGLPSQNIVFIDHIPVVKPFHISNIYSAFPEEVLQTADVYAGGFGAEFTNATSAVVDVQLRPGNLVRPRGTATVSPFITSLTAEGPLAKDVSSILISGRLSTISTGSDLLSSRQQDLKFFDLIGRYTLSTESFNCNITGMMTSDEGVLNPQRGVDIGWTNNAAGLRCFGFDGSFAFPFEFTLGYSDFENYEGSAANKQSYSKVAEAFIQFDQRFYALGSEWELGLRPSVKSYRARLSSRFSGIESFEEALPILQGYIRVDLKPNPEWTIQPGIGSISSTNGGPTFEPRLRISYKPEKLEKTEISAATGRYYQLADGISDQRDAGNSFYIWRPSQKRFPLQESIHSMIDFQQGIGNYINTNVEFYSKWYKNLIVAKWTPESQISTDPGLADGLSYGVDLRFNYNKRPLNMALSYGYSIVEYEAAADDLGAWIDGEVVRYNPAHDQRHRFNAVLNYDLGFVTTGIRWEFGTGLPYTRVFGYDLYIGILQQDPNLVPGTARTLYSEPYGARLPTYHRLDMSVRKSFTLNEEWGIDLEAGSYNLYNRANVFLYDVNEVARVDQIAFIPYLSVKTRFN
ncbi:carboxypeptidase regulatory-like domain-containing protein [Balneola sp. MJW-20]|uniref:TonB-dependent receptor n=1 Tax=Gracilimonas aurantiaca TaxID=3234185 RepID=UPI0034667130